MISIGRHKNAQGFSLGKPENLPTEAQKKGVADNDNIQRVTDNEKQPPGLPHNRHEAARRTQLATDGGRTEPGGFHRAR